MNEQKENIDISIKKIIDSKIFSKFINLYFYYKMNNIFQNRVNEIISIIITEQSPVNLVKSLFEIEEDNSKNFISLLVNDIINNPKFSYEPSLNKMISVLMANDCDILKQISTSTNPIIKEIINKDEKIKFFINDFASTISDKFSDKLLYSDIEDSTKFDFMGNFDSKPTETETQNETKTSKRSINKEIDLHFNIYNKYLKGEDYTDLLKEEDDEEKKKENEDENENENEENLDIDKEDNEEKEVKESPLFEARNSGMESENGINNDNTDDSEQYNDSNYWKNSLLDEISEDEILKELE